MNNRERRKQALIDKGCKFHMTAPDSYRAMLQAYEDSDHE